ncbi:MAG: NAD-dependent epimerase/dehydratase family protein [Caldilineaceae bacterium]|nr:NAD-dependent epimerase/dehydratase family protein [Caldilineaceae bacterium]HRJ41174.1 NAD-dependent epimerase/dehydratase family protein [Caldilineaceae bacterium]
MKVLVTGATGFLGQALARRLCGLGADVSGLGRNPAVLARLEREGIRPISADLADGEAIRAACQGQEIVFHAGALAAPWGKREDFYKSNVLGTQNVTAGCEASGVQRLVHVSTPSVYFGLDSLESVREDAPLPARPVNEYARTKLLAEGEVDRAFGRGLPVITIRPRAIFGPGDTTILPRLIARLKTGRLPIIGDGRNVIDMTYVENVVDALLLCAASPLATLGKKYNITNGEPTPLWPLIEKLCMALSYPYPKRHIPYPLADGVAALLEVVYCLLPGQPEPPLTRYSVALLAKNTTLDISAARRELGYQPRVSVAEGFQDFVEWWQAGREWK